MVRIGQGIVLGHLVLNSERDVERRSFGQVLLLSTCVPQSLSKGNAMDEIRTGSKPIGQKRTAAMRAATAAS